MTISATTPPRTAQPGKFGNALDWWHALGDVPLERIVMDPWPGTATEADLLIFVDRDKRLVELVDGTLVEKPVGWFEALIAMNLGREMGNFIKQHHLGVIAGSDGTLRMSGGNIRLPDITFVSNEDLPGGKVPPESVPKLPPTLAIEVISEGNTKAEMRRKIREYWDSGARLVWFVYPKTRSIEIFDRPGTDTPTRTIREGDTLDGGSVLAGFAIPVADVFAVQS